MIQNLLGLIGSVFSIGLTTSKVTLTASAAKLDVDAPVVAGGWGGRVVSIDSTDSPYTPGDESSILCDASAGAITIALPALAGADNRVWNVIKIDTSANAVTLDGDGAETIDGLSTLAINVPNNGVEIAAATTRWQVSTTANRRSYLTQFGEIYGDGSDGDVTVAGSTTLTRNMFYDNLVVTGDLIKASYAVMVLNILSGNGLLHNDGNAGSGVTAGTGVPAAFLGGSANGGAGSGGSAAGSAGSNTSGWASGNGSAGGISGSGQNGGSGGSGATLVSAANGRIGDWWSYLFGAVGINFTRATGGPGGGGGGAGAASTGGGGGSGGGPVLVRARVAAFTGNIRSQGGAGGDGTGAAGGGGGGGRGGWVILVTDELRQTPTVSAPGGAPGTGSGTGANGAAAIAGYTETLVRFVTSS